MNACSSLDTRAPRTWSQCGVVLGDRVSSAKPSRSGGGGGGPVGGERSGEPGMRTSPWGAPSWRVF